MFLSHRWWWINGPTKHNQPPSTPSIPHAHLPFPFQSFYFPLNSRPVYEAQQHVVFFILIFVVPKVAPQILLYFGINQKLLFCCRGNLGSWEQTEKHRSKNENPWSFVCVCFWLTQSNGTVARGLPPLSRTSFCRFPTLRRNPFPHSGRLPESPATAFAVWFFSRKYFHILIIIFWAFWNFHRLAFDVSAFLNRLKSIFEDDTKLFEGGFFSTSAPTPPVVYSTVLLCFFTMLFSPLF